MVTGGISCNQRLQLAKGLFMGSQKGLEMISGQDDMYIFSVISEETGYLGFVIMMLLILIILIRIIYIYKQIRIIYSRYIIIGISTMILIHFIMNISFAIGLIPFWDCSMTLFSFNPSSIMLFFVSIGIITKILVEKYEYW